MKKIIVVIVSCICFFSYNKIEGYVNREFKIDWISINIDIPLNANFNDYQDDYVVEVYVDGTKLSKSEYYCVLNQNGTSVTTVNTSKVGTYKIGARVELYNYNASSENYITYKVIDNEAPKLEITKDKITTLYGYEPDYLDYILTTDNSSDAVKVDVYDDHIDYKKVWNGKITIKATDSSGMFTMIDVELDIVDTIKPELKLLKPILVSLNGEIDIKEFLVATDHHDGNRTDFIEFENFDNSKLGTQYIYASVRDKSDNEARLQVKVEVVDDEAPIIEFNINDARIDINEDITYDKMKSFIKTVTDNYSDVFIDDVKIDFSNVFNTLGTYPVYYSIKDSSGNLGESTLFVKVVQMTGPTITCKDIIINKDDLFNESLIRDYISVYDQFDSNAINTLKIDLSGVNLTKTGVYLIPVTACNSSGVFSHEVLKITIEGNGLKDFIIYWPLTLIAIGPIAYFSFIKIKQIKNKKYE